VPLTKFGFEEEGDMAQGRQILGELEVALSMAYRNFLAIFTQGTRIPTAEIMGGIGKLVEMADRQGRWYVCPFLLAQDPINPIFPSKSEPDANKASFWRRLRHPEPMTYHYWLMDLMTSDDMKRLRLGRLRKRFVEILEIVKAVGVLEFEQAVPSVGGYIGLVEQARKLLKEKGSADLLSQLIEKGVVGEGEVTGLYV
jgi:hypothetical protein